MDLYREDIYRKVALTPEQWEAYKAAVQEAETRCIEFMFDQKAEADKISEATPPPVSSTAPSSDPSCLDFSTTLPQWVDQWDH